jgi:hypothetical protein
MKVGRPTDYSQEILDKSRLYLETYNDESIGDAIPSVAGLACYLNIGRSTIYEWMSQEGKEEFSDILNNILAKQENVLINKGLTGQFNSNIVKLALGKHGYSDKQELMGKDGEKLSLTVISYADNNSTLQLPTQELPTGIPQSSSEI